MAAPHLGAVAQDPGVTWLIFVDDLHLDFRNTGHIRTLLRSIAVELVRDGDAFVLRSSGPSPSVPFTTSRSLLDAAIGKVAGNSLPPAATLGLSPTDVRQDEVRYRASLAISGATEMLNADESQPGRRQAMLYVSNGYQLDADAWVGEFADAARRSNVTVFGMNARGLPDASPVPASGDAARWAACRSAMLNSLRTISEPTGGFAVLDETDFFDALLRIRLWRR